MPPDDDPATQPAEAPADATPPEPTPPPEPEPSAAITSKSAVVAALLLAAVVIGGAFIVYVSGDGAKQSTGGPILEGAEAPDFTLTSLEGEAVSLSDYTGRPVLINFWASWCPPCREEFPVLADARATYAASGFEILGVTRNDQPEYSQKFVDDSGAEWPVLPDPDDAVWKLYSPVGLPTSYFIDEAGVVQRVHIGPMNEEQLGNHLAAIEVPGPTS